MLEQMAPRPTRQYAILWAQASAATLPAYPVDHPETGPFSSIVEAARWAGRIASAGGFDFVVGRSDDGGPWQLQIGLGRTLPRRPPAPLPRSRHLPLIPHTGKA